MTFSQKSHMFNIAQSDFLADNEVVGPRHIKQIQNGTLLFKKETQITGIMKSLEERILSPET